MPDEGSPEVVPTLSDYLYYYDLEQYLFEQVGPRFRREHSIGAFDFFSKRIAGWVYSGRLWRTYQNYMAAVKAAAPDGLSLRDKDRYLWARSAAEQLKQDIQKWEQW